MAAHINLITGQVEWTTPERDRFEERKTSEFMARLGKCENACRYDVVFGWVPEADCPVHDL